MNIVPVSRLSSHIKETVRPTVLLITPPSLFLLDERVFMSLGILKVAAVLEKAHYPIEFLDLSGIENFVDVVDIHIKNSVAKHVAITITTPQLPATVKIVERIRTVRPDMKIIAGGPHVTLVHSAVKLEKKSNRIDRAHSALRKLESIFDVLVSGDGEFSIFEALSDDSPKIVDADIPRGGLFMNNDDYEKTPYPARHLVDVSSYKYSIDGHDATSLIAQLGCPFGCNFSVTGDALIFTDRGFERIDSMVSGEYQMEKCEHGGSVRVHSVNRKVSTIDGGSMVSSVVHEGRRPVFEVRASNGLRVKGTAEHPLLSVENGGFIWREIRDLKEGDWIVIKNPSHGWPAEYVFLDLPKIPLGGLYGTKTRVPEFLNEDVAWLTGYLVGNGCFPADGRPSINVHVIGHVREKLKKLVKDLFGTNLIIGKSSTTDLTDHGWIHSRVAYEFFTQSMGIHPKNKPHVPPDIIRSPKSVVESFLQGLLDSHGYEGGRSDHLTTVSYDLAREVSQLILMVGKVPSIHEVHQENDHKISYRVGFEILDRIPTQKALYMSSKSGKWYWRTPKNPSKFLGVRRDTLRRSGLHHELDRDGFNYFQVKSITPGLVEEIYDLRVPDGHNFIANGIVVHNCGGRNSNMLRRIRTRSSLSVISEIEYLHKTYGYVGFNFFDDELNVNKNIVELMDGISDLQSKLGVDFRLRGFIKSELFTEDQAKSMYRAGFRWLLCGFEAANPRILENINKRATVEDNTRVIEIASKFDLKVKALMSVGHAGESEKTIMDVRDWLLKVKPSDFDCTTITSYPGTPYYDESVPHESISDVWTYTCKKTGDKLHSYDVDYCSVADYYKGDPSGGYHSYVFTDYLSGEQIVKLRDQVENEVRSGLNIPFNPGKPGLKYDHSMGQGPLPLHILRKTS